MSEIILQQLSDKTAEGWNGIDPVNIEVNSRELVVYPANAEDERRYRAFGRWIYPSVYCIEYNDKLYRIF